MDKKWPKTLRGGSPSPPSLSSSSGFQKWAAKPSPENKMTCGKMCGITEAYRPPCSEAVHLQMIRGTMVKIERERLEPLKAEEQAAWAINESRAAVT